MIRDRTTTIFSIKDSIRIRYDGMGKTMIRDPEGGLFLVFQNSYGYDPYTFFFKPSLDIILYNGSLPLATDSKALPEDQ